MQHVQSLQSLKTQSYTKKRSELSKQNILQLRGFALNKIYGRLKEKTKSEKKRSIWNRFQVVDADNQLQSCAVLRMQFPQMNKYESLVERRLAGSTEGKVAFSFQAPPLPKESLEELLSDIDEINLARSFLPQQIEEQDNTMSSSNINSPDSREECNHDDPTLPSSRRDTNRSMGRSLIFAGKQGFNKKKEEKKVKVYFFDQPVYKNIAFDSQQPISHFISEALEAYISDGSLDQSKIVSKFPQDYQLRIPNQRFIHQADMNRHSLEDAKIIRDLGFDNVILIVKNFLIYRIGKGNTLIKLRNQLEEEIGKVQLSENQFLKSVLSFAAQSGLRPISNYYLTQHVEDTLGLPQDLQISCLQSKTLYIKSKRFIDQVNIQVPAVPQLQKSIKMQKSQENSSEEVVGRRLPIGLVEASRYEQFRVVKVNNIGVEQQRVMGIDQTKIYNYDRSVRQEKKETSFLSRIFGANYTTGTKRPFRLITDIIAVSHTNNGFSITFPDKTIRYIVDSDITKEQIFRKLNFLIPLNQSQSKNKG